MAESYAESIGRDRPPRIHMTYNVEDFGAIVKKELPFVVGVLAQLSGNAPTVPLEPLKKREFLEINKGNFNRVMLGMNVGLEFDVADKMSNSGKDMHIKLRLGTMDDFLPAKIVEQVEPLRKAKELRDKYKEMLTKANMFDKVEGMLEGKLTKPAK